MAIHRGKRKVCSETCRVELNWIVKRKARKATSGGGPRMLARALPATATGPNVSHRQLAGRP